MSDDAAASPPFLAGGGEVGALIRAADWGATPLGPPAAWPRSLQTVVRIMLTSRYAMWLGWGPDLVFLYNDAYRPTLGVKHPWSLGRPTNLVWAEIWKDIGPRIDRVMTTGEATWDEGLLLILERSGYPEETYHTFSYSSLADDDGRIAGLLCVVTEETERVIGERRLASLRDLASRLAATRSEEQALSAVAGTLEENPRDLPFTLTYLFEPDGRQATLAAASGIEPGHAAAPLAIDASAEDAAWRASEIRAGARPITVDHLAARYGVLPTGAWPGPPTEAVVAPVARQGQDEPAGFLVAALSPHRRLDAGYAGFIELVAGQVAAAIANARAYDEERRRAEALAEIDRAKTAFFSNISHEFRTPLTLILGPIEELLARPEGALGAGDRALLEATHRNGLRLLRLVNSLLDFSRIEAGRVQASYDPTDLAELTADLASSFRSATERAGLSLVIDCPALPEPVHVDREMWEKIVLNLVSNAFKFTFDGSITVSVRPTEDGAAAELRVRDTGIGIAADELPRLFERFHRVEGARGRTFEGSGIGLALVQELVRLHGGTIRAESRPGRGSTFVVTVPLGTAHLPADRLRAADRPLSPGQRAQAYVEEALRWLPGPSGPASHGEMPSAAELDALPARQAEAGNGRILLADDNADMRAYLERLLVAQGYEVEAVEDGEAALAAVRRRPPGLVLSDVMMPRLGGIGLLEALRADPALREIPVILLSARAGEEARVDGIAAGADDYLTKPFSARELTARVASNLQLARLRRETARTLHEEARTLEVLNRIGAAVAAELDLDRAVQAVTDAATELTGAAFGAFFYNRLDERGEAYTLYTLSGAPREAFSAFPMPRNTEVFAPTFRGEAVVRSDDITRDPRYGRNEPFGGMPAGHLPVRSYLAVPVVSRSGEVLGGLFFGHPEPGVFTDRAERLAVGIAAQAAIAIDNARLFEAAQREIAERRRGEEEREALLGRLRELTETLEARVEERTHLLAMANHELMTQMAERARIEEALRQAQKMETIGQLTGGVAHDFNNLLTVILGNLETLLRHLATDTADRERLRRAAENASRGAERAAALTQRLLAFSRRQPLDPRPLDVNRLVAGMSDLLRRTLGERIAIETVLAGGLWRTHADPNQLESAILNLAVNARDAMPDGGRLTIETANAHLDEAYVARESEVAPGQYVVVSVTDTGHGMSREVATRVFEPFFTTKEVGQGTGLGLSQVYGFVKQSGGHVKLYSEPGEGTTVKVYLPRLFAGSDEPEPAEREVPHGGDSRGEVVLVVEDDDAVRAHSADILRELGYRVIEAASGPAALDMLERRRDVSLLFTDIGLPGGFNGRQLADEARRRFPRLKVLFTTAYARNAIVHDGRLDPGVQLVIKPFTYATLAEKVRGALEGGGEPPTVLVVEDEALVRLVIVDELAALGYRVEEAATAGEAIQRFRMLQGRIDAAVLDMGLPDRRGDALALELRALRSDLPIVVASGYGDQAAAGRLAGEPAVRFLGKPYQAEQLAGALCELGVPPGAEPAG